MPVMFLAGQTTGQLYKHYNPSGVDVNNGLAYLRQILFVAFSTGIVMWLLEVVFVARAYRGQDRDLAKIGLAIATFPLLVLITLGVIAWLFPL